jgi:hypothetical protein
MWQRRTNSPDRSISQEAQRKIDLLGQARDVLCDPIRRAQYDQQWVRQGSPLVPPPLPDRITPPLPPDRITPPLPPNRITPPPFPPDRITPPLPPDRITPPFPPDRITPPFPPDRITPPFPPNRITPPPSPPPPISGEWFDLLLRLFGTSRTKNLGVFDLLLRLFGSSPTKNLSVREFPSIGRRIRRGLCLFFFVFAVAAFGSAGAFGSGNSKNPVGEVVIGIISLMVAVYLSRRWWRPS